MSLPQSCMLEEGVRSGDGDPFGSSAETAKGLSYLVVRKRPDDPRYPCVLQSTSLLRCLCNDEMRGLQTARICTVAQNLGRVAQYESSEVAAMDATTKRRKGHGIEEGADEVTSSLVACARDVEHLTLQPLFFSFHLNSIYNLSPPPASHPYRSS